MTRQDSINAQLKRAAEILPKIEAEYNNSLHAKNINEDLKLDVQTMCGHLRSALDYLAKDIVEKYCPAAKVNDKFYFPITGNAGRFIEVMNKSYPELILNCPDLYTYLESIQPYFKTENIWLSQFNDINNENKHNNLVEQTRTENRRVTVTSSGGGGQVSWGSGVTFGAGVSIMGVPIDPRNQMPVQNNIVNTEVIIWVDFKFNNIDVSALGLLKESLEKVNLINSEITNYL